MISEQTSERIKDAIIDRTGNGVSDRVIGGVITVENFRIGAADFSVF